MVPYPNFVRTRRTATCPASWGIIPHFVLSEAVKSSRESFCGTERLMSTRAPSRLLSSSGARANSARLRIRMRIDDFVPLVKSRPNSIKRSGSVGSGSRWGNAADQRKESFFGASGRRVFLGAGFCILYSPPRTECYFGRRFRNPGTGEIYWPNKGNSLQTFFGSNVVTFFEGRIEADRSLDSGLDRRDIIRLPERLLP